MKSLFFRQFVVTACLVMLCVALFGFTAMSLSRNYFIEERHDSLLENAKTVAATASAFEVSGNLWVDWYFKVNVSTLAAAADAHIFLANSAGEVVVCSDDDMYCEHLGFSVPERLLFGVQNAGTVEEEGSLDGLYPDERYTVGVPVFNSYGMVVGYVFVSVENASLTAVWRNMFSIFAFTALVVLLIVLIVSYIMAHRQTKPLNDMASAAQRFGHGEFDARVDPEGRRDELGTLMNVFNNMADSLESADKRRSEFVANVSHELKTPITTISGYADGLLDGTIPQERAPEYLRIISDEAGRMGRMVRRMLELSRLQSVDRDALLRNRFDVTELIARVLISLEGRILEHGLDVDTELPEEEALAFGDADSIQQVIYNLLDNAIKFAHRGSVIRISLVRKNGKHLVSVANRGDTIAPEELQLIFDRFHKTDRSRSLDRDGVGLGLYIAKTIINNHREEIYVTSADGVTEFSFTLRPAQ